jgi:hypothetical protein
MSGKIEVVDRGARLTYSFEDILKYHGPGSPGGAGHAFKVLSAPFRCSIRTFLASAARSSWRPPSEGLAPATRSRWSRAPSPAKRIHVDAALARPERGRALERFVFRLGYRDRRSTLALREAFVTDEFIDLARSELRNAEQERRRDVLKREMAERVMARPACEVYDATEPVQRPQA